jgi:hypothetical protein
MLTLCEICWRLLTGMPAMLRTGSLRWSGRMRDRGQKYESGTDRVTILVVMGKGLL